MEFFTESPAAESAHCSAEESPTTASGSASLESPGAATVLGASETVEVSVAKPEASRFPPPPALHGLEEFLWHEGRCPVDLFRELGQRLADVGDLYRAPSYAQGLILANECANMPTRAINDAKSFGPILLDRLRVKRVRGGKLLGYGVPQGYLSTMLASEVFLRQFRPLDVVTAEPRYSADFSLPTPGYNSLPDGTSLFYQGGPIELSTSMETIRAFLDVVQFEANSDRTNAVAAALTAQLRHLWPGAKPFWAISATKSHADKGAIVCFAAGSVPRVSISYRATDQALERNFISALENNANVGIVVVENACLERGQTSIASGLLERLLTDPAPFLSRVKAKSVLRPRYDLIVAVSTNDGAFSNDLLNLALPIRLAPVGNVEKCQSPLCNPKIELLPKNRLQIEAELRGMIERWKTAGRPLAMTVQHQFREWAQIIGGILHVNGFKDFLGNCSKATTEESPLRQGLGILGASRADAWLTSTEWSELVFELGLVRTLIAQADRENAKSRARGIGVLLSKHVDETFVAKTEDHLLTLRLEKARRRFAGENPSTRYQFRIIERRQPVCEGFARSEAMIGEST